MSTSSGNPPPHHGPASGPGQSAGDDPGASGPLAVELDRRGVATLTLSRPEVRNAFDGSLVAALADSAARLTPDDGVRVAVLTGAGTAFSAGADLETMRAMRDADPGENLADARALESMLHTLDTVPVPVVGRINGPAIGGGVGLVACCDVAVAASSAVFAFSEVRLGLAPAVIAPFVVAKTGPAFARAAFVTGGRFDAARAREVGLVHEVVPDDEGADGLDERVAAVVGQCLRAGPRAVAEVKRLPERVQGPREEVRERTAALIARLRTSEEGQEGIAAFLERRAPSWVPEEEPGR
ncbi:enoyl-CoA hydratase/isomerase family protein [Egibacter rhizosphaerae]|uniref:Enoyl-CoA hydratase/isomerase family protein n=1 Tax=Egibacter rhizosphaerae TaxID=1670831 RepID=A0A411YHD3_9ACTN|nr:enoyl-CoA hydratase-related protein [Egibacter rhizosphaerae]QBI20674.1 enoyl-CoA hydratase/isomerase family protein [Egibacter rhizosphaerae]